MKSGKRADIFLRKTLLWIGFWAGLVMTTGGIFGRLILCPNFPCRSADYLWFGVTETVALFGLIMALISGIVARWPVAMDDSIYNQPPRLSERFGLVLIAGIAGCVLLINSIYLIEKIVTGGQSWPGQFALELFCILFLGHCVLALKENQDD